MDEVRLYLQKLLKPNDKIVLALSGGPDSMCLLDILLSLPLKLDIICAHINHNIRKESADEAEFLKKYCNQKKTIFEFTKFPKKSSFQNFSEQELRQMRYTFLEQTVKKYHAKFLFTAHHGDDLIETILMKIARGSTIKGYCGFLRETSQKDYVLVRPLITITKQDIEDYNKHNKIPYFIDKTNFDDTYTRNRYRHNILPFLKKENSDIHLKYLKFSQELIKYYDFAQSQITKEFNERFAEKKLNIENYSSLPTLIQEKIIELFLEKIYGNHITMLNSKHINNIIESINNPKPNIEISLPNNIKIIKSYNSLSIETTPLIADYCIEFKGKNLLPNNRQIIMVEKSENTNNNYIRLNSTEIKLPLYIRNRRPGDKMIIKNMVGSKKIKDIFIDSKLTKEQRINQPILVDSNNNILWLPGLRKSKFDKAITEFYDIILWYN